MTPHNAEKHNKSGYAFIFTLDSTQNHFQLRFKLPGECVYTALDQQK